MAGVVLPNLKKDPPPGRLARWQQSASRWVASVLEWPRSDRALLLLSIGLPFCFISLAETTYFLGQARDVPYFDLQQLASYRTYIGIITALLGLCTIAAIVAHKRAPNTYVVELAAVVVSSGLQVGIGYFFGLFTTSLLLAQVGTAAVVLFLFDRSSGTIAFGIGFFGSLGIAILEKLGIVPYAPLLTAAPTAGGHLLSSWFWGMGIYFLAISAAVWAYLDMLVLRWREREQMLRELAVTDVLTGVANRRHLFEVLGAELVRAHRYKQSLSCLMVDLDHFKRLNDEHGHQIGDQALAMAARALSESVRATDTVGRYGGEEFVVILPHTTIEAASVVAERCREAIRQLRLLTPRGPITISASIGVSTFVDQVMQRPEDVLLPADKALYQAKAQGRDRVCLAM